MTRFRYPSPALVVAVLALFVSLSGTAVAAGVVPMAKKALFANNAARLQGKTLQQVAAIPGPSNKAATLVSVTSVPFSLGVSEERDFTVQCASGAKAISGGYTSPNTVLGFDSRPSPDGAGWGMYLVNLSNSAAGAGTVHAVCLR
jgi:hypothetical protein